MDAATEKKLTHLLRRWQEQGRTTPLADLCRDCPELLPELERRIRQVPGKTQTGPEPTRVMASAPAKTDPSTIPPVLVPGYEFRGELGRGGMGVVYKAFDPRLKRLVAIKMVHIGDHVPPQYIQRFKTEMETVAQLKHPNIVQIYECGEQEGQPYCVLEFVEGGTLYDKLEGQPLPPRDSAQLLAILARAMHAAHRKGIIHRDLKPANILLEESVAIPGVSTVWGCPKITDFGLVKRLDTKVGPTTEGALLGTPSYMSPEQASGENQRIGPASDIYSLGAIFYETLTGRPPFKSKNPVETIVKVVEEIPATPSTLCRGIPPELERICMRCLEKDPVRRYPSAAALAEEVEAYLQSLSGSTGHSWAALPPAPVPRHQRNPWIGVGILGALIAVLSLGVWWLLTPGKTSSSTSSSPTPRQARP
jgi:serine/threonine-protein kinase